MKNNRHPRKREQARARWLVDERTQTVLTETAAAIRILTDTNQRVYALINLLESSQRNARAAMMSKSGTACLMGTVGLSETSRVSLAAGHLIHISDGIATIRLGANGRPVIKEMLNAINSDGDLQIVASLTKLGLLRLEATGCNPVIIGGTATDPELAQLGLVAGASPAGSLSKVRSMYARQFGFLASKIDLLVADVTPGSPNLLDGENLKVRLGGVPSRRVTISGVNFKCRSLGISGSSDLFQTEEEVRKVLVVLGSSLSRVITQSITFASRADLLNTRLGLFNGHTTVGPSPLRKFSVSGVGSSPECYC